MFGARVRARRPILLLLVLGVFLVIVGITATAQAIIVSTHPVEVDPGVGRRRRCGDDPQRGRRPPAA